MSGLDLTHRIVKCTDLMVPLKKLDPIDINKKTHDRRRKHQKNNNK